MVEVGTDENSASATIAITSSARTHNVSLFHLFIKYVVYPSEVTYGL